MNQNRMFVSSYLITKLKLLLSTLVILRPAICLHLTMFPTTALASTGGSSLLSMNSGSSLPSRNSNQLPEKVLIAYTSNHCDDLNNMSKVSIINIL